MCIGCVTSATAQRSITDTTFTVSNVEIVANKKQALQDKPVELLGMDVPLKFLPITVTRLDSKTMERKHITNMEDAVRFLPGVVMSSNQLGAFQRYSVRGTTDAVFAFDGIRDDRTLLNTVPFVRRVHRVHRSNQRACLRPERLFRHGRRNQHHTEKGISRIYS